MIGTRVCPGTARRPAPCPAVVAVAALLVATAACGRDASSATHRGPAPTLSVLSVSFVSASAGWLLATPCADQVQTCRAVVLMRTVDGGRTWSAIPAPDAPPADQYQGIPPANAVGTILFADARAGWAFGPALWQTRDGGVRWQKMSVPGGPVQDLAAVGNRVVAVTGRCGVDHPRCSFGVYSAVAGSDDWRAIPGAAGTGVASVRLVVSGAVGYVLAVPADLGRPRLIAGPLDGAARWRPLADPCRFAGSGALAASPGGWLFLGCGGEPGAGNQLKTAWLSRDGGRTWLQVAPPPFGGYLGGASMSQGGTIFLSGSRMDIYVSRDRGRSWQQSPSLANAAGVANAGFPLDGLTITDTQGVAYQEGVYQQQIWLTSDGGRHWTPVTIRAAE